MNKNIKQKIQFLSNLNKKDLTKIEIHKEVKDSLNLLTSSLEKDDIFQLLMGIISYLEIALYQVPETNRYTIAELEKAYISIEDSLIKRDIPIKRKIIIRSLKRYILDYMTQGNS